MQMRSGPRVIFPDGFNERAAFETPLQGWLKAQEVTVQAIQGAVQFLWKQGFFASLKAARGKELESTTTAPNQGLEPTRYPAHLTRGSCVPGMAQSSQGGSPRARYSRSRRRGAGYGRHRDVRSGGSPSHTHRATHRHRSGH